jgi:hypothetical protein
MLSGAEPEDILRCVRTVLDQESDWAVPPEVPCRARKQYGGEVGAWLLRAAHYLCCNSRPRPGIWKRHPGQIIWTDE